MVGGYFSFSGIGNQARYNLTPLAKALPVSISNYDDRVECPEGVFVEVTYSGNTRLFEGIRMEDCPPFGGYNKTVIKRMQNYSLRFMGTRFWQAEDMEREEPSRLLQIVRRIGLRVLSFPGRDIPNCWPTSSAGAQAC